MLKSLQFTLLPRSSNFLLAPTVSDGRLDFSCFVADHRLKLKVIYSRTVQSVENN